MQYLILQNPGHNRVYYKSAEALAVAELSIAAQRTHQTLSDIKSIDIAGVRYISFCAQSVLDEYDINMLSRLSFFFALFNLKDIENQKVLIPVAKHPYEYLDDKISSLLKYQGKTNELFTKMMINVALLSGTFDYTDHIAFLDPVAGKGTSLFEAAVYGFNAYGIEIESKSVHDAQVFFKKYLENERIKHKADKRQIYSSETTGKIYVQEFSYAKNKADFKSKSTIKTLALVNGVSGDAYKYFKKPKFNMIVGDLPYGIFHGNKGEQAATSKTRNPKEFLSKSLEAWYMVLKKGGVVVVAWNSFVVSKEQLAHVFENHRFEVLSQAPYSNFEHMVDKSIKRDIIVARKI